MSEDRIKYRVLNVIDGLKMSDRQVSDILEIKPQNISLWRNDPEAKISPKIIIKLIQSFPDEIDANYVINGIDKTGLVNKQIGNFNVSGNSNQKVNQLSEPPQTLYKTQMDAKDEIIALLRKTIEDKDQIIELLKK